MNKKTLISALGLSLILTGCTSDEYVSVRHPDASQNTVSEETIEENLDENPSEESLDQQIKEDQAQSEEVQEDNQEDSQDATEQNQEGDGINYTVEDTVNVRVAPSESSEVMATVEAGDDILKLGESDNWTRISIDGQTGYIRSDLLIGN